MNIKILTAEQQLIKNAYKSGIKRIYFSGAKNTSKNLLADLITVEELETHNLANAVGFRESKVNAVGALTKSFLKHINLFSAYGYQPKYPWETNSGNVYRKRFQGVRDKYKNQGLYLFSMENKNSVSNVSFTNKGYAAFVFLDEVCSADQIGKSPLKLREDWELATSMIEDSLERSVIICEQQNPELKNRIPPTKWMYMFNLWLPEHPVAIAMEKYVPEKKWSEFIFPEWFNFYEIYAEEKLKTRNKPIKWLAEFMDAPYEHNLIKSVFLTPRDRSLKQNVLEYLAEASKLPFDEPTEHTNIKKDVPKKTNGFEEIKFDSAFQKLYRPNSIFAKIVENFRINNMLGVVVRQDEYGNQIDSLFVRSSKWLNPTIEKKHNILVELISEVKDGIVRCDSLKLAQHLGFFRVSGISNDKAYSIEDHVEPVNWKEWVETHPEYVPVDSFISVDIDFSRRFLFTPTIIFAKFNDKKEVIRYETLTPPQTTLKTYIKEVAAYRFDRFIMELENVKRKYIDVLPWEDYDNKIRCTVIMDNNYSFVGSVQTHYYEMQENTQQIIFDIIKVIPSKQGTDIKKNGYGIKIRQDYIEHLLNTKTSHIDKSNAELLFCIYNIPKKKDGSGIRDESGIFERMMDTLNGYEYSLFDWRKKLMYNKKE